MPDKTKATTVAGTKYNEAIEKANSEQIKREKIEEELAELKKANEEKEVKEEKEEGEKEKKAWEKEKTELEEQNKKLEEKLKAKKDDTVDPKGVVSPKKTEEELTKEEKEDFKSKLDEAIPFEGKNPNHISDPIARLKHFKSPITKGYSPDALGKAISLQAEIGKSEPDSELARAMLNKEKTDIIVNK